MNDVAKLRDDLRVFELHLHESKRARAAAMAAFRYDESKAIEATNARNAEHLLPKGPSDYEQWSDDHVMRVLDKYVESLRAYTLAACAVDYDADRVEQTRAAISAAEVPQ